mgnify:CR=1 FL=1
MGDVREVVIPLQWLPAAVAKQELLLQYLTAPYLRVPLLLRFFSQASHTAALAPPELQDVLDAAVFEPGLWQPNEKKEMPKSFPMHNCPRLWLSPGSISLLKRSDQKPTRIPSRC